MSWAGRAGLALPGVLIAAVIWQTYAMALAPSDGRRAVFPTLTETIASMGQLLTHSSFWGAFGFTLRAWGIGLACSVALAVPLGLWIGLSRTAYRALRVPIELIRPIPAIIILPLVIVLLGTGVEFQVVLIMQGVLWPVLIQTAYGVHLTHATLLDTAKSFRFGQWRSVAFIRFPSAAPLIATSLKVGAATAFAIAVTTEYVGGSFGLGHELLAALTREDAPQTYAITLFTGVVGIAMIFIFTLIERYFARWAPGGGR